MVSLSSMLMAPVKGAVWVVKLPFLLVWMLLCYIGSCLYRAAAAVLSVPAHYLSRAGARLKLTWIWAKTSAGKIRLCLPFISYGDPLVHGNMRALPPPPGHEYDSYNQPYPPLAGEMGGSAHRRRHSSKKQRKAIVAALSKLLLEPCSPSDSDEDGGEAPAARNSLEVEERTVKLIMDLLKISKGDGDPQLPRITPQDLQALRERARSQEQLESLIAEVDQIAFEGASPLVLDKRQKKSSKRSKNKPVEKQQHKTHRSSSDGSPSKRKALGANVSDPSDRHRGEEEGRNLERDEGMLEEEGSEFTAPLRHRYAGDLSPVQESPEYKPEEVNYKELENDLNLALSKLNSEISELPEVKEQSVETQITHTVTVTSTQPPSDEVDNLFEDSREEFPTVPKVNPSLGLKAGHDRRHVAAARKPRPPTRNTATQQSAPSNVGKDKHWRLNKQDEPVSDDSWDDSDLSGSGDSEGEGGEVPGRNGRRQRPRKFSGGLQLSDQFQLLSPTSRSHLGNTFEEISCGTATAAGDDLYAKVNKKKKSEGKGDHDRPRTGSDPTPTTSQSVLTSRGSSNSMPSDDRERDLEDSLKKKSGPFKANSQPPWIEMRSRKSSESSAQSNTTAPFSASSQPPWIQMRSHKNSSGHSSPASTPTSDPLPLQLPRSQQHTPKLAHQSNTSTSTAAQTTSGRVLPPKPSIPRPDPPTSSSSAPLLETYDSEEERKEEGDNSIDDEAGEGFYDLLQPKDEVPQRESRIFPLDETRVHLADRPRYLHEAVTEREGEEDIGISRSRRAGSLRIDGTSPALPLRNPGSQLKRTSSADTVRKPVKSERDHGKKRHTSSSEERQGHVSRSRGRSDERRSSDGHRRRNQSSSSDRTPSRGRHHSSDKRGSSSSSSKGSPSPRESTSTLSTMWKLLSTPTSSRRRHSSSGNSSPSSKEKVVRRRNSSKKDNDSPDP